MSISINVTIDKEATSMTITVDDGTGTEKSVVVPVHLDGSKKKTPAQKEVPAGRPLIDPIFTRFIETGDVAEIREVPDFKKVYKNYVFCRIKGLNGRTLVAEKAVGMNKIIHGIMTPTYWDDETLKNLETAAKDGPLTCVLFGDGSRPFIVNDIMFLDKDWDRRGRLFNSLYAKPREE